MKRHSLIFALGMVVLLVLFWIGGDNAVVYVISLLGVPIVSGVLAGLHWIRFWLAALACLAVVAGQGRYAGQPRAGSYPRQEPIKGWQQSALREPTAFPDGADTLDRVRSPRVVPPALAGEGNRSPGGLPGLLQHAWDVVGLDGPN